MTDDPRRTPEQEELAEIRRLLARIESETRGLGGRISWGVCIGVIAAPIIVAALGLAIYIIIMIAALLFKGA